MNEIYSYDEWFDKLCDVHAAALLPMAGNAYYKGKLVVDVYPDGVKLMNECEYCGTSPFIMDSRYPRTCAKCGAPV